MLMLMLMLMKQVSLSSWSLHSKANTGSFVCSCEIRPPFMLHRECKYRRGGRRAKRMVMLSNKNQRCRGCSKFVAAFIASQYKNLLLLKTNQKSSLSLPETMIGQSQVDRWNQKQMVECQDFLWTADCAHISVSLPPCSIINWEMRRGAVNS